MPVSVLNLDDDEETKKDGAESLYLSFGNCLLYLFF